MAADSAMQWPGGFLNSVWYSVPVFQHPFDKGTWHRMVCQDGCRSFHGAGCGRCPSVSFQSDALLLASAPALMVRCGDAHATNERGTILFYHGFGADKESYLATLAVLADAEFLAVGIDAVGHGARRSPDFDDAIAALPPGPQLEAAFLGMVRDTAREVPAVIDALADRGLAAPGRIGVAGWSMGGFIAYAAVVADRRICAAVSVLGSPQWRLPWPESPHLHPERFFPTALLSQVAGADRRVPPQAASDFHRALVPYYMSAPERLRYMAYDHADHAVTDDVRQRMHREMVRWFARHLAENRARSGFT